MAVTQNLLQALFSNKTVTSLQNTKYKGFNFKK